MNKPKITIIELPMLNAAEAAKAQWWRQHIVKLSKPALASAIGISVGRIDSYERGYGRTGKPFSKEVWENYKRRCFEYDDLNEWVFGHEYDDLNGWGFGQWNWGIK